MKIITLSKLEKEYLDKFKEGKRIVIYPQHIQFWLIEKLLKLDLIELEEDCEYTFKLK